MSRPAERVRASTVNQTFEETVVQHSHKDAAMAGVGSESHSQGHNQGYNKAGGLLIAFLMLIFFWFIVFIILIAWCPKWLQKRRKNSSCDDDLTCAGPGSRKGKRACIDYSKTALWAFVITIIAVLLFWLLAAVTGSLASLLMGKKLRKTVSSY